MLPHVYLADMIVDVENMIGYVDYDYNKFVQIKEISPDKLDEVHRDSEEA